MTPPEHFECVRAMSSANRAVWQGGPKAPPLEGYSKIAKPERAPHGTKVMARTITLLLFGSVILLTVFDLSRAKE